MKSTMFTLMVQGTTSDAGKSTLVAGLGRIFSRLEKKVAPFKPQNMALNSAVTQDGGEIGRAQALQAAACGIDAHTDMNPVLIKPSSDTGAQIIIHGKALQNMEAGHFHDSKPKAMVAVLSSYERLSQHYDIIVVEGAGSPAEINLREGDIANMGFAEAVDCPVIIVADIDRGGVFAHLVGTLALLSETEQRRVIGFVINRFRGDIALLQPGLDWLEKRTNKPVLGVIPYLHNMYLDAEDAIVTEQVQNHTVQTLNIVVPVLPRISNHTDFDALRLHPNVNLHFVNLDKADEAMSSDLIILPGTKNVREDLRYLHEHNWDKVLQRHLRYGGKIIGICGGYQMLGHTIDDPDGIEGRPGCSLGFHYIPISTTLFQHKTLARKIGMLSLNDACVNISGYEIHCGKSTPLDLNKKHMSLIDFAGGKHDGYISEDNQIIGSYLHGLFDTPDACNVLLAWAGLTTPHAIDLHSVRERQINRLADTIDSAIDFFALDTALLSFYQQKKAQ